MSELPFFTEMSRVKAKSMFAETNPSERATEEQLLKLLKESFLDETATHKCTDVIIVLGASVSSFTLIVLPKLSSLMNLINWLSLVFLIIIFFVQVAGTVRTVY
jgi:hypothetical protein